MDEKLRILLCEDDENLGMLLREYLQAKGYSAELFPDGEAGFKAFLKNKYDLCVLDVMMPKKDGFTLAQEIRQANAEIPIIFLKGHINLPVILYLKLLGFISNVGNYQYRLGAFYIQPVFPVKIGNGTVGRSFFHDISTNDGFSLSVFHHTAYCYSLLCNFHFHRLCCSLKCKYRAHPCTRNKEKTGCGL